MTGKAVNKKYQAKVELMYDGFSVLKTEIQRETNEKGCIESNSIYLEY